MLVILCALSSVICLSANVPTSGKYFLLLVMPFSAVDEKEEDVEDDIPSTFSAFLNSVNRVLDRSLLRMQ